MSARVEKRARPSGPGARRPAAGPAPKPPGEARGPRESAERSAAPAGVPALASAAFGALSGAIYRWLAPPVSGPKDAAEFTLVLATGGAAHPTGYPLYVMLGHLFAVAMHAMGASWAYAANAWSAVGGGVAIALLHALAARVIPPRLAIGRLARIALATFATAIFALDPIWLLDAMLAETYTWHLVWVCAASLFALGLVRALADRERNSEPPGLLRAAIV